MCGICGIATGDGQRPSTVLLQSMARMMRHRGPDDEGYLAQPGFGFGFQRLSIIDLQGGHQPMTSADGAFHIVFNGEIYNFQSLRAEIEQRGVHFRTRSDTEVLLEAYRAWGDACVTKLRGMFSFAIWDQGQGRLFAARDRFGKKPFYYFKRPGGDLVFASELKALRQHPDCPSKIDLQAINLYLGLQYIPAPKTIFEDVFKLPAAHALSWSAKQGLRVQRYWDLRYEPKEDIPYEEAKEHLRSRLDESVKLRMIADVPLGAFLSGGSDSSILVAIMAQNSPQAIKTFSIGFEEEAYSELEHARIVAQRYRTDHHEFIVKPELIDILPKLAWYYSEPFADPSALPSYYLARETRRHVTVALNGDGGDELFGGYLRYRALWAMELWNWLPGPVRRAVAAASEHLPKSEAPIGSLARFQRLLKVGAMSKTRQYAGTLQYFHEEELQELWKPDYRGLLGQKDASNQALFEATLSQYSPRELLDRLMYLDLHHYLPDCLMAKTDIASMSNSLEARSPFLDHVLAEEVTRWPVSWKFSPPNNSKRILKDAYAKDLPESILRRGKQGFGVPISQWFRGALKGYLREALLSPNAFVQNYFRPETLRRYVDDHQSGVCDRGYGLWALLMLELWHRAYFSTPEDIR